MFMIKAGGGRWQMIDLQPLAPLCGFGIIEQTRDAVSENA